MITIMSAQLDKLFCNAETVLVEAPCTKYDAADRRAFLAYKRLGKDALNKRLPYHISQALKNHLLATQSPPTKLASPVVVFCEDDLRDSLVSGNLDLLVKTRLNLGRRLCTYEDLVRWYLAVTYVPRQYP